MQHCEHHRAANHCFVMRCTAPANAAQQPDDVGAVPRQLVPQKYSLPVERHPGASCQYRKLSEVAWPHRLFADAQDFRQPSRDAPRLEPEAGDGSLVSCPRCPEARLSGRRVGVHAEVQIRSAFKHDVP